MANSSFTAVDLFAGAGGLSEGLRQAGGNVVVASDFDESAGGTYVDNHRDTDTKFVLGDLTKRSVKRKILEAIGDRQIDIVAGGPPCQAFSQMRNHDRKVEDPRNRLYRDFLKMVEKIKPRAFIMENVVGLRNLDGGAVGERIVKELSLRGSYRITTGIVDAADFGVPQTRRRVVIIGIRSDLNVEAQLPQPRGVAEQLQLVRHNGVGPVHYTLPVEAPSGQLALLDARAAIAVRLADARNLEYVTVKQALSDLENLQPADRLVRRPSDEPTPYPGPPESAYQRLMRARSDNDVFNADVPFIRDDTLARLAAIPPGGNFRDIPPELTARYLTGKKWGPDIGKANLSRRHYYAYRKLHPDYVSWTLNTKADCVYHYSKPRALSVREFARLHSFPDHYSFLHGDRHSRYRQIGNAVPPLLGKALAAAIAKALTESDATAGPKRRRRTPRSPQTRA